jgi:hypothetical protein
MALAFLALGAAGASAQTAFKCVPATVGVQFKDAHCKEPGTAASGWKHEAIAPNTPVAITFTNLTTGTTRSTLRLKGVQVGVGFELQSGKVEGTGTLENNATSASAEWEGTLVLKSVTVAITASPPVTGCTVTGGTITTNTLIGTTAGLTNQWKLAPAAGERIATFTISGCSKAALNHTYETFGSVAGSAEGATTVFTHAATTAQGTLRLAGQTMGLDGSLTLQAGTNGISLT